MSSETAEAERMVKDLFGDVEDESRSSFPRGGFHLMRNVRSGKCQMPIS